jgi:hypothetical protein
VTQRQHNMTAVPSDAMEIPEDERPRTQVERIAAKFGSIRKLWRALKRLGGRYARMDVSTLYKWNLASGQVPTQHTAAVNKAARIEGIVLTDEDWSPVRR